MSVRKTLSSETVNENAEMEAEWNTESNESERSINIIQKNLMI